MSSRWIPAFALMAVVCASTSGCTIRTGEPSRDVHHHHHHNNKKSPPPAPKKAAKKADPAPAPAPEPKRAVNKPADVDPGYRPTDPGYRPTDPTPAADSDKVKWEKLGEGTANGKNDKDVIQVGRAEGKFSAIRFKVTNSGVKLQDVVVHFADGTKFSPTTKLEFKEGENSNVIDLPGSRRAIKSVNFRYSDSKGSGNAQVEVWGRN